MRASYVGAAFVFGLCGIHCAVRGDLGFKNGDSGEVEDAGTSPDGFNGTDPSYLRVTPMSATIAITNGDVMGKAVTFTAEQKQADGTWTPTTACEWSLGNIDVGALSMGVFSPSGLAGGITDVTCTINGTRSSAKVTVTLDDTIDQGSGLDGSGKTSLVNAQTPDPSVKSFLYPYDKTVFPRGLSAAPELMWTAPGNDTYAAIYSTPYAKVTAFFKAAAPGRFALPVAQWNKLTLSAPDAPLKLALNRLQNGTSYAGPTETWTLSRASLKGTAYYWQLKCNGTPCDGNSDGAIVRMQFGQTPQKFLQTQSCTGCHAVASKGDAIAAGMDVYVYSGAFKKTSGAQMFKDSSMQTGFRAISRDGAVISTVNAAPNSFFGGPLFFVNGATGQMIGGAPSNGLTATPSFSSSGKLFAYSIRKSTSPTQYGKEYHDLFMGPSDIALSDYDEKSHQTSNPKTIIAAKNTECLVFPTLSPDDTLVAYQKGMFSNNRWHSGIPTQPGPNAASLWIAKKDGTGAVEMANASASDSSLDKLHSYHPMFSPVVQGGYFWVMFTSLRTYGNRLAVTEDYDTLHCQNTQFADCRHQQVWVAAVDVNGNVDPSHPAFWLPGQDNNAQNFDAQWSLDACKKTGDSCEAGFECCEGTCRYDNGKKTCGMRMGCAQDGDTCSVDGDCCNGAKCIGGVCSVPVN